MPVGTLAANVRMSGALQVQIMLHHYELKHEEKGTASAMRIEGELDVASAAHFRRIVGDLMGSGVRQVEVDLSATEFVDSSGLGALLWAEHRLKAIGGRLDIVNPRQAVARTFALAGLDGILLH